MTSVVTESEHPFGSRVVRVALALRNRLAQHREVNAYFLTNGTEAWLVDAGHADASHAQRILEVWRELGQPRIRNIILTHGHLDHAGGIAALLQTWNTQVQAHPLEADILARRNYSWKADFPLQHGGVLNSPIGLLTVIHSPGHSPGHVCLLLEGEGLLLTGDNVLTNSSTLISAPDGDMTRYMRSLRELLKLPLAYLAPGHGPVVANGWERVADTIEHRRRREGEILSLVRLGKTTIPEIATVLYGPDPATPHHHLGRKMIASYLQHLSEGGWLAHGGHEDDEWRFVERRTS